jgi:hypothetical protein
MTIPEDPTPIDPEPEPIPDAPGGPGPSDRSEFEIDGGLEATFPSRFDASLTESGTLCFRNSAFDRRSLDQPCRGA